MTLVDYDHVIETFSTYGANHSFDKWILPWRARCSQDFLNAHTFDASLKRMTINSIAIADQEPWRFVKRKRLDDLLRGPFGSRVSRYIEVHDAATIVAKYDEREQNAKRGCWNSEEVDGYDVFDVVIEERTPGR